MRPEILFVDDDKIQCLGYLRELGEEFEIHYARDVATARSLARSKGETLAAVIMDVMMPTPEDVDPSETDGDLETGLWLLGRFEAGDMPRWPLPTVLLTNRLPNRVQALMADRKLNLTTFRVHQKVKIYPRELRALVHELIAKFRSDPKQR